jgi:hypothetical protein
MRARGWRPAFPLGAQTVTTGLPLVSSFSWDTGAEVHWKSGPVDVAGAVTRGAPAAPAAFSAPAGPSLSGRVALLPAPGLTVGLSAARGQWVDDAVASIGGLVLGRTHQRVIGADAEYGMARWLLRAEWIRSSFDLPVAVLPALTADSAFVEGRVRWTPRWQAAARVERLAFTSIVDPSSPSSPIPWDAPVKRVEAVIGYRVVRNLELRGGWQQDWRTAGRVTERGYPVAQALFWF